MKYLYTLFVAILLSACSTVDGGVYDNHNKTSIRVPVSRQYVATKVQHSAIKHRVPITIAKAVTHVESRFQCHVVGPHTKYGRARGPLQIMPSSARSMFGYNGPEHLLANCEQGLEYGMLHLARCYKLAGGDPRGTAHCHVQGPHRNPFKPVNAYARNYGNWVMAQYRRNPGTVRYTAVASFSPNQPIGIVPGWTHSQIALVAAHLQ
jgi:hypothetical protein